MRADYSRNSPSTEGFSAGVEPDQDIDPVGLDILGLSG
jgi:hypothetical protein